MVPATLFGLQHVIQRGLGQDFGLLVACPLERFDGSFSGGQSLDDQQVTKLERLANAMAATSEDPRVAAFERRARRLVTAERQRRDDWIRQR